MARQRPHPSNALTDSVGGPSAQAACRRLVTVVCCDVRATGAADGDARAVRHAADAIAALIHARRGHVARVDSGRLLAYFGHPVIDDQAALTAVRTAVDAVRDRHGPVMVRAAVDSDLILTGNDPELPDPVGRLSGEVVALTRDVPAGEVGITEAVGRSTDGYFERERLRRDHFGRGLWRITYEPGIRGHMHMPCAAAPGAERGSMAGCA